MIKKMLAVLAVASVMPVSAKDNTYKVLDRVVFTFSGDSCRVRVSGEEYEVVGFESVKWRPVFKNKQYRYHAARYEMIGDDLMKTILTIYKKNDRIYGYRLSKTI